MSQAPVAVAATHPPSGPRPADALDCLLFDFGGTLDSDGVAWNRKILSYQCVALEGRCGLSAFCSLTNKPMPAR